jgi:hypothetical protein
MRKRATAKAKTLIGLLEMDRMGYGIPVWIPRSVR